MKSNSSAALDSHERETKWPPRRKPLEKRKLTLAQRLMGVPPKHPVDRKTSLLDRLTLTSSLLENSTPLLSNSETNRLLNHEPLHLSHPGLHSTSPRKNL